MAIILQEEGKDPNYRLHGAPKKEFLQNIMHKFVLCIIGKRISEDNGSTPIHHKSH